MASARRTGVRRASSVTGAGALCCNTSVDVERAVLVDFLGNMVDKHGAPLVNLSRPVCEWRGFILCNACGRVTSVFLFLSFVGTTELRPELAELECLENLTVERGIVGQLHSSFARLTRLRQLELSSTAVSGTIPSSLSAWTQLEGLQLDGTLVSGTLHTAFSAWTSLTLLDVSRTAVSGTIPPAFAAMRALGWLDVRFSQISGTLDPTLAAASSLSQLFVTGSLVSGTLAPAFAAWRLDMLVMGQSLISGTLDASFSAWSSLHFFDGRFSQLSGTLSPQFAAWSQVHWLALGGTGLSGSIPVELANWTNIDLLGMGQLPGLSGTLDARFSSWTSLRNLDLSRTSVSGELSAVLSAWTALVTLDMHASLLSGTLSPALSAWTSLQSANLRATALSGTIPGAWGALTSLRTLRLQQTRLSGYFDEALYTWNLALLDVSDTLMAFDPCLRGFPSWDLIGALDISRTGVYGLLSCGFSRQNGGGSILLVTISGDRGLMGRVDVFAGPIPGGSVPSVRVVFDDAGPQTAGTGVVSNVTMCYEGPAGSAVVTAWTLFGVGIDDGCDHDLERTILRSVFLPCNESASPGDTDYIPLSGNTLGTGALIKLRNLTGTYCIRTDHGVKFINNNLTCPAWSSVATGGVASLNVDPAFLAFWGCACPAGQF
jgi:hypothetical protein